jgi:hypothetical protein
MKVIVIAHRADRPAEDFAPYMEKEAKKALSLVAEGFIREIYSRQDGNGAVMVCEAKDAEEVGQRFQELPFVQQGLLTFEIYPVVAYRGIVAAAQG